MLITSLLFLIYSLLSWVLFFRDERALTVFNNPLLWQIRDYLLSFKLNTVPTLLFLIFLIVSFYFYFKALKKSVSAKSVIICAICFQIIVFFSYPILSTDIFSYVLSDRIDVVYHQNVWKVAPDNFKQDLFYTLSDWTDKTRIYGGVNQFFYSVATSFSGNGVVENIVSHKLVVFLFVLGTLFLIPSAVVFWNPLFVIETVGSGHNDILMLFFTVLALKLYDKNIFLSAIALGLATQVKTVPVLLFIFLALKFLSELRIRSLLNFTLLYFLTVLCVYWFMGVNPLDTVSRTAGSINVYWQSLPMLIRSPILSYLLIIFLGIQAIRTLIFRLNAVEIFAQTLLVYLLFFLAAFWNWYPIWLLVLIPFLPESSKIKPYILALTFSSMLGYVAYWTSLRFNYQFFLWPVIIYLTVLSGPLAVCLINIKKKYL